MKKKIHFISCLLLIAVLPACRKDKTATPLPAGSVSIQALATADTIGMTASLVKDSLVVIGLKATLQGKPSTTSHRVSFDVDTNQLAAYRSKYGAAVLLPSTGYFFYHPDCSIAAGATLSDSAEINLVNNSKLQALTTYVLPLVIRSVDGGTGSIAAHQVLYLVVHTGKSPFIPKTGWKIVSFSSTDGADVATNLLDNDDQNTAWGTSLTQTMPQYVEIDFGQQVIFSGVTYRTPSAEYNAGYGFPKQIKIELSTDGTNWTNKGNFPGQTSDATQTIDFGGLNTARYLRFTVTSVPPFIIFQWLVLGGIGLEP